MDNASQKSSSTHKVRHGIFTAIGILLCVILIPVVIINCTLIAKQITNQDEVPSFGGVFPMIVLTDSMSGTFDAGSLIICTTVDAKDVKTGDIICYFDPAGSGSTTTTHRVQEIKTDQDGSISFITKGDANNTADKTPVPAANLVGVYRFHIEGLGSFAMFMQTTPGLIIFAVLPVLALILYDVVRRRIYDKQKATQTDALVAELESLRAQKDAQTAQQYGVGQNGAQQFNASQQYGAGQNDTQQYNNAQVYNAQQNDNTQQLNAQQYNAQQSYNAGQNDNTQQFNAPQQYGAGQNDNTQQYNNTQVYNAQQNDNTQQLNAQQYNAQHNQQYDAQVQPQQYNAQAPQQPHNPQNNISKAQSDACTYTSSDAVCVDTNQQNNTKEV